MSSTRAIANVILTMVLLGLLITFAVFAAGPWFMFGSSPLLKVGYINSSGSLTASRRLLASVEAAVEDINLSVRSMSPPPPSIRLKQADAASSSSPSSQFKALYDKAGVRMFFLPTKMEVDALREIMSEPRYSDVAFVTVDVIGPQLAEAGAISKNMRPLDEARGYLELMVRNNPTDKRLDIVVVVEEGSAENQYYYDLVRAQLSKSEYSDDLKLTRPVYFEASQYPKGDALQIVAEISSRLVLHPNAHIFLLSSLRLMEVAAVAARMNPELPKRRWYARDMFNLDLQEKEDSILENFFTMTSLTTLTYLAEDDGATSVELQRRSLAHIVNNNDSGGGGHNNVNLAEHNSLYLESLAYATVMDMHKAFTASKMASGLTVRQALSDIVSTGNPRPPLLAFRGRNGKDNDGGEAREAERRSNYRNRRSFLAASLVYYNNSVATVLPFRNWIVSEVVHFNPTAASANHHHRIALRTVYSHPLERSEVEKVIKAATPQCEESRDGGGLQVSIWVHPSIILPEARLTYDYQTTNFLASNQPLVIPASEGLSMSLECSPPTAASNSTETISSPTTESEVVTAFCVPRKFNQGNFTCELSLAASTASAVTSVSSRDRSHKSATGKKIKREAEESAVIEVGNPFEKVRKVWSSLVPDVFSCTASVAGCDFCFYYLATYNLSVAPAACIGGCSLSTFGSCSKLVGSSIVQTFDLGL